MKPTWIKENIFLLIHKEKLLIYYPYNSPISLLTAKHLKVKMTYRTFYMGARDCSQCLLVNEHYPHPNSSPKAREGR
jgi:hypothetical protein